MEISFTKIKRGLSRFIERFHVTLFTITILGGLVVAMLFLNNVIVTSSSSGDYTPDTHSVNFDQTTIDRIEQLKTRDEGSGQLDLSQGRTNPFVE